MTCTTWGSTCRQDSPECRSAETSLRESARAVHSKMPAGYTRGAGIPGRRFAGRPELNPPEPPRGFCDLRNTVVTCTLLVVVLGGAFILIEPVEESVGAPSPALVLPPSPPLIPWRVRSSSRRRPSRANGDTSPQDATRGREQKKLSARPLQRNLNRRLIYPSPPVDMGVLPDDDATTSRPRVSARQRADVAPPSGNSAEPPARPGVTPITRPWGPTEPRSAKISHGLR